MRRSGWSTLPPVLVLSLGASLFWGCVFEFKDVQSRERGSVGSEVFRIVCMKLAAQAVPNDLTGNMFSERCDGKDTTPVKGLESTGATVDARGVARLNALLARRKHLVPALDSVFDSKGLEKDELRTFLDEMVPLYDPPSLLPTVTRQAADLLQQLVNDKDPVATKAVEAFARMGWRDGYRPLAEALGMARTLAYPELDEVMRAFLTSVEPGKGYARAEWEELLRAMAFDLATADEEAPNPDDPGTLATARKLLFSSAPEFSGGNGPKWLTERDLRGVARARLLDGVIPAPFQDSNGDGLADIDNTGRLMGSAVPTSFRTLPSVLLGADFGARDSFGRAKRAGGSPSCNSDDAGVSAGCEDDELLYDYFDADKTLLAGFSRELGSFLRSKDKKGNKLIAPPMYELAYGLNAILGPYGPRKWKSGDQEITYMGPDTSKGPFFDLVHAFGSFMPFKETEQLLQVLSILIRDHERELAGVIEAGLYIDERADSSDAHWEPGHDFWDDAIAWGQGAMKHPGLIEGILRVLTTEQAAKSGPLMGNFMRFKDAVSYPNGKLAELTAEGIDPLSVSANVLSDADLAAKVQKNREFVNYPCNPPPAGLGAADPAGPKGPGCVPNADHPAKNHKGIRPPNPNPQGLTHGCPDARPTHGASCADAPGVGLCSYDEGSCVCDCEGGLCRHNSTPTWRCEDEAGNQFQSVPGYDQWVDRSQPDVSGNESLFQRSAHLTADLHVPSALCNKEQARMVLFAPAGGVKPFLPFNTLKTIVGDVFGEYAECAMLVERQIAQFYARTIFGKTKLAIQPEKLLDLLNGLDQLNLQGAGLTPDGIMERQSQIRGLFMEGAAPQAIARMVFAPLNPFERELLDLPKTWSGKPIALAHADTMFAWELDDPSQLFWEMQQGADPKDVKASYYDALTPLLKTLDEAQFRPAGAPAGTAELADGEEYLFGSLLNVVHRHWASRQNGVTVRSCDDSVPPVCKDGRTCAPDDFDCLEDKSQLANDFSYQSNGVSYEELAAETLVDAQMLQRVREVMVALDNIEITDTDGSKIDGITVLARGVENLLDPTKSCLAGDCENHPLTDRRGRTTTTTGSGKPVAITPMHLMFDALNAIDKAFEGPNQGRLAPWRESRGQLVDLLLEVERTAPGEWRFENPRSKPLLLGVLSFASDQIGRYRAKQEACLSNGGAAASCQQLREWSDGLTPRLEKSLSQPITVATLRLLERLWEHEGDPTGKILGLLDWMVQEDPKQREEFDTALYAIHDLLQLFDDSRNTAPIMRFLARSVAPNATAFARGADKELQVNEGTLEYTLKLMRSLNDLKSSGDGPSTITTISKRLVKADASTGQSPIELIIDTIAEVNRVRPGTDEGKPLDAADLRSVLDETQQFLSDRRHGLERLYDIIQAREIQ